MLRNQNYSLPMDKMPVDTILVIRKRMCFLDLKHKAYLWTITRYTRRQGEKNKNNHIQPTLQIIKSGKEDFNIESTYLYIWTTIDLYTIRGKSVNHQVF